MERGPHARMPPKEKSHREEGRDLPNEEAGVTEVAAAQDNQAPETHEEDDVAPTQLKPHASASVVHVIEAALRSWRPATVSGAGPSTRRSGQPMAATRFATRRRASRLRSMSASVVAQEETLTRIAA